LDAAEHVDDDAVDLELDRRCVHQVEALRLRFVRVHSEVANRSHELRQSFPSRVNVHFLRLEEVHQVFGAALQEQ